MKYEPNHELKWPQSSGRDGNDSDNIHIFLIPPLLAWSCLLDRGESQAFSAADSRILANSFIFQELWTDLLPKFRRHLPAFSDKAGSLCLVSHQPESRLA